ncbi:hypothetical protein HCN44_000878 [Aphidius gifuensis]|uniref:Uncharacterized protein n=1 Tax=Aphidius gifuensis TaxID=684658 RepID=A0A834XJJ3_APHGI|nr:hypothetical protein HCN44_000878 [Aphidius gifuensis]
MDNRERPLNRLGTRRPRRPRGPRGPYKKYLEPGSQFSIPKSTLRNWKLKQNASYSEDDEEQDEVGENQHTMDYSTSCSSSTENSDESENGFINDRDTNWDIDDMFAYVENAPIADVRDNVSLQSDEELSSEDAASVDEIDLESAEENTDIYGEDRLDDDEFNNSVDEVTM